MTDANVSVSFSASIADFVAGVGEAKEALQSFSAPFGAINGQLASLAEASSQAFSAERLQPYRAALIATQALEQSFAANHVRAAAARCAPAMRKLTPTPRGRRSSRLRKSCGSLRTD